VTITSSASCNRGLREVGICGICVVDVDFLITPPDSIPQSSKLDLDVADNLVDRLGIGLVLI
jgi:hypothetical protein